MPEGSRIRRGGWAPVWCVLAVYASGFFLFYPDAMTVTDEALYLRQAFALTSGSKTVPVPDPLTGEETEASPASYPLGTALLLAPFISMFGWKGSFLCPLAALLLATLVTARWLHEEGRRPIFSLLIVGFLPGLVLGRVPMSDVPSCTLTALGLWLFWRSRESPGLQGFLAGLVAGTSLLFRETNVLVFAPFLVGAVVRRERDAWIPLAGLLLGVCARLGTSYWAYGDPFFLREEGSPVILYATDTVAFYLLVLTVLAPGGLIAGLGYRGRRSPEAVTAFLVFVLYYMSYDYHGARSGGLKGLVLGSRYILPLMPLIAFESAEVFPRLWRSLTNRMPGRLRGRARLLGALVVTGWVGAVGVASFGVHPLHARWGATQGEIREAIYRNTATDAVIVTNRLATDKFINDVYGRRVAFDWTDVGDAEASAILRRHGAFYAVFLDRRDSDFWRAEARATSSYLEGLGRVQEVVFDSVMTGTDRLRIWRVRE